MRAKHRRRLLRRAVITISVVLLGMSVFLLSPQPTIAEVQGNCLATINHITASRAFTSNNAIEVYEHSSVAVFMQMDSPIHRRLTYLSFGLGPNLLVGDETDPSSSSTTIDVDKYATYGVGLYRVQSSATSASGQSCHVDALVRVDGNPLTTVTGGSAAGLEVLSLLGIGAAALGGANPGEAGTGVDTPNKADDPYDEGGMPKDPSSADTPLQAMDRMEAGMGMFGFCLLASLPALFLTSAAMVGGASPSGAPVRLPRYHWRPRFSVLGMGSGVVGGLAAVVLLQQTGKLFPSYEILGRALVVGLLVGILLPSLTRVIAVRRANRRVLARELGINRALAARTTTAPAAAGTAAPTWVGTHRALVGGAPWRSEPDPAVSSTSQFSPGTTLRVLQEGGGWSKVQAADGTEGWVETAHLERMT
ncbi:MAG: SH3 domain-containing protein [Candidatus Dormibacteraeota bacterium]|nr:SH3 domain-containing protein [Candidatus Dormibacteraeota bacterium]